MTKPDIVITDVHPITLPYGPTDRSLDCTVTVDGITGIVTLCPRASGQGYEPAGDSPDCWIERELLETLDRDAIQELAAEAAVACERYVW